MIETKAQCFAQDWIAGWNSRDIDRILEHYSENVEFTSPFVKQLLNEASGTICTKLALRAYFQLGLNVYPELHFDLLQVLVGVDSVTLYYRSVKNLLAAEVMYFDATEKVCKVVAHYSS